MKGFWFLCLILGCIVALSSGPARSATLGFEPSLQAVSPGEDISVGLVISGLGDYSAPSLGAFDITVGFDPSLLSFSDYTLGPYLGDLSLGEAMDVSSGQVSADSVNLVELSFLDVASLEALQPSSFTIATLTFEGLQAGNASFHFSINAIGDEYGNPLPEPRTVLLLSLALVGIAAFRKRHIRV